MSRVYVPVSIADVVALRDAGALAATAAYGLTAHLRAVLPQEDEEGLEHVATQFAAASCAGDPVAVAVFEVPSGTGTPADAADGAVPGALRLERSLTHRELVCFLVADPGQRVSDDADLELSWYDAGELLTVASLLEG